MTRLIIDTEHDMECNINYITDIVQEKGATPNVEITFPSEALANCFVENLLINFRENKVPKDVSINIQLNIPKED